MIIKRRVGQPTTPPANAGAGPGAGPPPAPSKAGGTAGKAGAVRRRAPYAAPGYPVVAIDDRAGSKDLVHFAPLDECGVLTRLDAGDVAFEGKGPDGRVYVGVEVKSIFDLISSMDTGRLQGTQVPAMLAHFDVSWLLYYGHYRADPHSAALQIKRGKMWRNHTIGKRPVPYGYVEAFLLTLNSCGILVKRVRDKEEAARWIGELARWWSKPWDKHRGMHAFDWSRERSVMPNVDADTAFRARFAAQLPAIGYDRALAVARHFPTVEAMVGASVEEWIEVPGIGKVIAKAAWESLRRHSTGT